MTSKEYKQIKNKHNEFAEARGDDKTYCPSEVARQLYTENWRDKLDAVKEVADDMWNENQLIVSQFGKDFDIAPTKMKGHIRLRKGPNFKN